MIDFVSAAKEPHTGSSVVEILLNHLLTYHLQLRFCRSRINNNQPYWELIQGFPETLREEPLTNRAESFWLSPSKAMMMPRIFLVPPRAGIRKSTGGKKRVQPLQGQ